VIKVKGHTDDDQEYDGLTFQGRRNANFDGAVNRDLSGASTSECVKDLADRVDFMMWTKKGSLTREPCK